jgi:16S rRNA (guanine(966)-N(2))-methyltransferase RsmD
MRIVAGSRKGHRITAPPGRSTRPTSDRVRENVFNIVAPWVEDAAVLDLFAGSGAMGLEALSRGAARAVFVESDTQACRAINENLDRLRLTGAQVLCQDVSRFLGQERRAFDLVFCDPPYDELERRLPELSRAAPRLLAEDGLLVLESSSRDPEPELEGLETTSSRRYGAARITLFRR